MRRVELAVQLADVGPLLAVVRRRSHLVGLVRLGRACAPRLIVLLRRVAPSLPAWSPSSLAVVAGGPALPVASGGIAGGRRGAAAAPPGRQPVPLGRRCRLRRASVGALQLRPPATCFLRPPSRRRSQVPALRRPTSNRNSSRSRFGGSSRSRSSRCRAVFGRLAGDPLGQQHPLDRVQPAVLPRLQVTGHVVAEQLVVEERLVLLVRQVRLDHRREELRVLLATGRSAARGRRTSSTAPASPRA